MSENQRLPKLCWHKHRRVWYVRVQGQQIYLGPDQVEAEKARLRILAELKAGRVLRPQSPTLTVLADAYLGHCDRYYRRADGTPTGEAASVRRALGPLLVLYGAVPVADFKPKCLEAVQHAAADGSWLTDADRKAGRGPWCRKQVNKATERVKRMLKWGVKEELCPLDVYQALCTVEGLARGRTVARETGKVPPADPGGVAKTLPHLCERLRAMVLLQLETGMRPDEVCRMRPGDIDRTGSPLGRLLGVVPPELRGLWVYLPGLADRPDDPEHKTAHHECRRVVPLTAEAQRLLAPWLDRPADSYCFSPAEARRDRYAAMRKARKSKVPPSQIDRGGSRPKRLPGARWTRSSYANAVARAVRAAGVARWTPGMLRKTAADRLERLYGERVAATILGHADPRTTRQFYLSPDLAAAFKALSGEPNITKSQGS
jgi:integrase